MTMAGIQMGVEGVASKDLELQCADGRDNRK